MNFSRVVLMLVAGIITASCSEKSAPDREKSTTAAPREPVRQSEMETNELRPDEDKIAEDCVALVRSTKIVPASGTNTDCPSCPAEGSEMLSFRQMKMESVTCSGDACTVVVIIRAIFNPGSGQRIAGGLTGWISPEQRSAYLNGQTPAGEQAFRVQITYKRRGEKWQAVEFDRSDPDGRRPAE